VTQSGTVQPVSTAAINSTPQRKISETLLQSNIEKPGNVGLFVVYQLDSFMHFLTCLLI
jgi:hypothetical protein